MTLKEIKQKTFSLIEEYYPEVTGLAEDEDVKNKINGVVNQIQLDLMKYRKLNSKFTKNISIITDKTISISEEITDCYQIKNVILTPNDTYTMPDENTIVLNEDYEGTLEIYYYKYPALVELNPTEQITNVVEETEGEGTEEETEVIENTETTNYDESFVFELDPVLLEIMPYGIAADLLKMDMISGYGRYFAERYAEAKREIDSRRSAGMIFIDGGVDI